MKRVVMIALQAAFLAALSRCVSAERKAEYVPLEEFKAKNRQGCERADRKKSERLAREEKERQERLAREEAEHVLAQLLRPAQVVDALAAREEAARVSREEAARVLAQRQAKLAELQRKRTEVRDAIVTEDLTAIRNAYAEGNPYQHTYYNRELLEKSWKEQEGSIAYEALARELEKRKTSDWLKEWVEPRLGLSEADKLAGEALLTEFGNKYMPKAYANYEKVKVVAIELQQVFNEEFPEPWTIKNTSSKWNSFKRVLEKFAKARTEYFMCHDELCHYWVSYRLGVVTAEELVKIDSQVVAVKLLPENKSRVGYTIVERLDLDGKDADFASKYAPETYAVYQRMEQEWKQTDALLDEIYKQRVLIDAVRFDRAIYNAQFKCNDLVREMNALVVDFQSWNLDHRIMEKSSEDVAKLDQERAKGLKEFADSLPTYVKDRTLGRIIPMSDMILLPVGSSTTEIESTRMQRTEVTQMQWMLVMGTNPSENIKPDCPVENVSWVDCQLFIEKLNELEGTKYRLPREVEWEYACHAGSAGDWGTRRNGEEGPLEAMGWYDDNSGRKTHAVATRESNAWGLYDMHGNVREWCEDQYGSGVSGRVCRGGSWNYHSGFSAASRRDRSSPYMRFSDLGFRLAASQD